MLVGHCDDMSTARTLGPLRDLIGSVGADLSAALRDGDDRDRILTALRAELDWPGHPTVLAIEDVHWADDATLDMLRYLVRRVAQLPVVLVLTYRDDELGRDHPLHQLLGLVTGQGRRLELLPLSLAAVRELSAPDGGVAPQIAAEEVYSITSGNPFFVSEVLAAGPAAGIPRTVTDAYAVENIYETCQTLQDKGVTINRPPRDGNMAFIRSPDGISIELIQKGPALPPQEPWLSMPNTGSW